MSNHGKRMVKENLIAQIGQGGGTEYTAGDGISISEEDVISVDNTVALKSELPEAVSGVNDGTNWTSITIGDTTKAIPNEYVSIEYTSCIGDYVDPSAPDTQAAINRWLANMPILLGSGTATAATLTTAGYTNLIPAPANGTRLKVKGYFGIVSEDGSGNFQHINYFCTDAGSSASTSLINRIPTAQFYGFRNSSTQVALNACRIRLVNTSISIYTDLLNNSISVMGFASNMWSTVALTSKYATASNGFEAEGSDLYGSVSAGANVASALKAPTADGTYTLKATVSSGVATFSWVAEE